MLLELIIIVEEKFFGHDASVSKNIKETFRIKKYEHYSFDILNKKKMKNYYQNTEAK